MTTPVHVTGGVGTVQVDLAALLATGAALLDAARAAHGAAYELAVRSTAQVAIALEPADAHELTPSMRALAGALGRCATDADRLSSLLLRSVHCYESADGMVLDPFDKAAIAVGRAGLGALELSIGQRTAAAEQFGTAVPEAADALSWLAGTPLEAAYTAVVGGGQAQVRDLGPDMRPGAVTPPVGLAGALAQLALRNTGHNGEISVSLVVGADGRTRAIVDIPGTKSWNPWPTHDVTGVGTDALAVNGIGTSYEDGVLQALQDAGVGRDMPVMLVGHSLGGIIAVNVARTAVSTGRLNVTHVVTAGAPIGRVVGRLPTTVSVLALENSADVVPDTDGVGNPVTPNVTTVTVTSQQSSIGGNHDLGRVYQPAAAAADASDDPSIEAFLSGADGFLHPTAETTHAYWLRRG